MKTIGEAARDYANKHFEERLGNCGAKNGFLAGVNFAQQWISVDDELPKQYDKVFVMRKNGELFFCWYAGNGQFIFDFNNERFSFYTCIYIGRLCSLLILAK